MGRDTQQSSDQLIHVRLGKRAERKNCQLPAPREVQDAAFQC